MIPRQWLVSARAREQQGQGLEGIVNHEGKAIWYRVSRMVRGDVVPQTVVVHRPS